MLHEHAFDSIVLILKTNIKSLQLHLGMESCRYKIISLFPSGNSKTRRSCCQSVLRPTFIAGRVFPSIFSLLILFPHFPSFLLKIYHLTRIWLSAGNTRWILVWTCRRAGTNCYIASILLLFCIEENWYIGVYIFILSICFSTLLIGKVLVEIWKGIRSDIWFWKTISTIFGVLSFPFQL